MRAIADVRARSHGYTLLELLAYVVIFGVVVNLAAALFVSSIRLRIVGNEAIDRMQALDEIGDAFSTVVRESFDIVPRAGAYETSADMLVLALPGGRRYAALGRLRGDDRLVLMRFEDAEGASPDYLKTFPYPLNALEFNWEHDPGGRIRIVMRVDLKDDARPADVTHTFVAAPRSYRGPSP